MSIITGTLGMGRTWAAARMTDACLIGIESAEEFINEDTGNYEKVFVPVYEGPCELKTGTTAATDIDAQSQFLVEQDAILKLPIDKSVVVGKDMIVKFTASLTDPALPGTRARVKGPAVGSYATSRRFTVEITA